MTDYDAGSLNRSFQLTHRIIRLQTAGLSDEDSLLQPPFRGNCLNWVLGHIIVGRSTALVLLDQPPVWGEAETRHYQSGSAPLTDSTEALSLERLLGDLDRTQELIADALGRIAPEALSVVIDFRGSERTLGQALADLHWHETYHTGQLELLRQLAGKNDAII